VPGQGANATVDLSDIRGLSPLGVARHHRKKHKAGLNLTLVKVASMVPGFAINGMVAIVVE